MPVGNPKSQTIASKKYQEKAGIVAKSYKLKRELVEEFANACEAAGISQAAQLTCMMKHFNSKYEVEKEYTQMQEQLADHLCEVNITISELKAISRELNSEEIKDKVESCINKMVYFKKEILKCRNLLYDIYNEIYQQVYDTTKEK